MITRDELQPLMQRWLPQQRWFGGKGRGAQVSVDALAPLGDSGVGDVTIWIAHVDYGDGTTETYQVPLVAHTDPVPSLDHVLLGTVDTPDGPVWLYDALHEKEVTRAWLAGLTAEQGSGPITFHRHVDVADIPVDEPSLVLTGEQSNTSLMYGDVALLKVFRRLQPGVNPDIEVHAALGRIGARHVARLLGDIEATIDGEQYALAMLQEFMTTASDGWELAKTSVRDLMAEADLHADEAGGDFAGEAERLGAAIAEMHEDLATAFGTRRADRAELQTRTEAMRARLDRAVTIVPELADLAPALRTAFHDAAATESSMTLQRIHGDLHLAQALRTVKRWVIIDFEGEPMADLDARRAFESPLRDVAGMLRSFEYAGHHRLVDTPNDTQLAYRADEWSLRNRQAFCAGYTAAGGTDPQEHAAVLRAYEADKAVYEAVYEARNRPAWLPIPLASLTRLAEIAEASL